MHRFHLSEYPDYTIHHNGDYSGDVYVERADPTAPDGYLQIETPYERIYEYAKNGDDLPLSTTARVPNAFLRAFIGSAMIDRKIVELESMDYAAAYRRFVLKEEMEGRPWDEL